MQRDLDFKRIVFLGMVFSLFFIHKSEANVEQMGGASKELNDLIEKGTQSLTSNLDSAIYYFDQVEELGKQYESDSLIAFSILQKSRALIFQGLYQKALESLLRSKRIYEQIQDSDHLPRVLLNIGVVKYRSELYEEAIQAYNEGIQLIEEDLGPNHPSYYLYKGRFLGNKAIVYESMSEYDQALELYFQAIIASKEANDKGNEASCNANIGINYMRQNKLNLAIDYLMVSYELRKELANVYGQTRSLLHLSHVSYLLEDYSSANQFAKEGLILARELNSPETLVLGLQRYSNALIAQGKADSAVNYLDEIVQLKDSIYLSDIRERQRDLEMEYQAKAEEVEAQLRVTRRSLFLTIFFFTLLALMIYILFLLKRARVRSRERWILNEKLELDNQTLTSELVIKNRELASSVIHLAGKNNYLEEVCDKLTALKSSASAPNKPKIQKVIADIKSNRDTNIWEEFDRRFVDVHAGFYDRLLKAYPDLTANEKKLCAFLKLNMSNHEISELTGQTSTTLNVAKTRLRKKLEIENSYLSLNETIASI